MGEGGGWALCAGLLAQSPPAGALGPRRRPPEAPEGFSSPPSTPRVFVPAAEGPKQSGLRGQALPGLRRRVPSLSHLLSASRDPACVPAGSPPALQPRPLRALPPAPRPFPPAGHAHPEDEVEKHQHGLGGGDATLAHGAAGRLRLCSASARDALTERGGNGDGASPQGTARPARRSPQPPAPSRTPAPASTSLLRAAAAVSAGPPRRSLATESRPGTGSSSQSLLWWLQRGHTS